MLGNAAQAAEAVDIFGDRGDGIVDFFLRIKPPNAKPQTGSRQVIVQTEGSQNMARLRVHARASAAARNGDRLHAHHQRLTVDQREGTIEVAGKADGRSSLPAGAIKNYVWNITLKAVPQAMTQCGQSLRFSWHL